MQQANKCFSGKVAKLKKNKFTGIVIHYMELFYRKSGQGEPLIILHGLFGSSDNWYSLAKTFSAHFTVYLVDQRNHGQSPHDAAFNYEVMTKDFEEFVEKHQLERAVIIGHSMGGKVAMNYAVKNSSRVSRLIVVDIVPKHYPVHHDSVLDGLQAVDIGNIQSRGQAEEQMAKHIPDADVRQFLLKSLTRKGDGFEWRINIPAIDENIESIGAGLVFEGTYNGPSLFVMGARSNYFAPGDEKKIQSIFPAAQLVTLDTSHWVHAEKPAEFADTVLKFLDN